MKHFTFLLLLSFCLCLIQNAQSQISFIDDFEAFNVGDYISENSSDWKTWNSKPGSASDCQVTDEKAASGSKSIHIYGSNNNGGGPMDILLPFQGTFNEGRFTQSMNIYIEEGKNAHFNYQANKTHGQKWALYGFFRDNGILEITNGDNDFVFSAPFPNDVWFNFELDVDLTSNIWRVKVDGTCLGSFQNSINRVSSISFYTLNNKTDYFMDDIAYVYDENTQSIENDLGIIEMDYKAGGLIGITQNIYLELGNFGTDTITQAELTIVKDGEIFIEEINGLYLVPGGTTIYETVTELTVKEGKNSVAVSLSKINNLDGDDNDCNNIKFEQVDPVKPALYKGVLVEEATGTWCQWCVRGSVFMDRLSDAYEGYFIPIAIHNGDPMVISSYDNFITSFPNFAGFPNAIIARQEATGFGVIEDMESPFLREVQKAEPLFARAGVDYNPTTREMKISAFITFLWDREDDYTVQMVITEDGVTGTESGYAQSNAYAGGANGPMGGYENLPQIVPAESMVYDHVARAIYGLNATEETTIKGPFTEGQTVKVDFVHTVPVGQIPNNMYLIPIVLHDGAFVNAGEVSFEDAVQRGIVSTKFERPTNVSAKIFPNPASMTTSLDLQLKRPTQVIVEIFDVRGQLILTQDYGNLQGDIEVPLNITTLENGIYLAKINTDDGVSTKRFIIQK